MAEKETEKNVTLSTAGGSTMSKAMNGKCKGNSKKDSKEKYKDKKGPKRLLGETTKGKSQGKGNSKKDSKGRDKGKNGAKRKAKGMETDVFWQWPTTRWAKAVATVSTTTGRSRRSGLLLGRPLDTTQTRRRTTRATATTLSWKAVVAKLAVIARWVDDGLFGSCRRGGVARSLQMGCRWRGGVPGQGCEEN